MSSGKIYTVLGDFWRLPVLVTVHQTDIVHVELPDLPLLAAQKSALRDFIAPLSVNDTETGWFLNRSQFDRMAMAWEGDPEASILWAPPDARVRTMTQKRSQHWIEVRDALVKQGWFQSEFECEVCLQAVTHALFDRLVNQHQPVDLGFAEIAPDPRRTDWVRQMKEWKVGKKLAAVPQEALWAAMRQMCSHAMTQVSGANTLLWGLTLTPKRNWWRTVLEHEKIVSEKLRQRYSVYVTNCLRATLPQAVRFFDAQIDKASQESYERGKGDFVDRARKSKTRRRRQSRSVVKPKRSRIQALSPNPEDNLV